MTRFPLCTVCACILLLGGAGAGATEDTVLPRGKTGPALVAPHFPDRVHEFVFRNWNVIEPAKMAAIVNASVQDVTAMAASMGLPPATAVPAVMRQRGYVTLIRRNWHLLPYEQLLQVVEMTPERLAFAMDRKDWLPSLRFLLTTWWRNSSMSCPASSAGTDRQHPPG